MASLEDRFEKAMVNIYYEGLRLTPKYVATYFIQMVRENGGVAAAQRLLQAEDAQAGLFSLYERDALYLSVEALVIKPEWEELFTATQRREARARLAKLDYRPEDDPRWR